MESAEALSASRSRGPERAARRAVIRRRLFPAVVGAGLLLDWVHFANCVMPTDMQTPQTLEPGRHSLGAQVGGGPLPVDGSVDYRLGLRPGLDIGLSGGAYYFFGDADIIVVVPGVPGGGYYGLEADVKRAFGRKGSGILAGDLALGMHYSPSAPSHVSLTPSLLFGPEYLFMAPSLRLVAGGEPLIIPNLRLGGAVGDRWRFLYGIQAHAELLQAFSLTGGQVYVGLQYRLGE